MDLERWRAVEAVLQAALDRPPAERGSFLDQACAADPTLRQEIESLLRAADDTRFLEPAPLATAAPTASSRPASDLLDRLQQALGSAYRIERELGGGGMARIFVATDSTLGRRVVLKVLPPELAAGLDAERFHREVRLAASLQHPHVVPLHTAGQADGLLYYTMPFVTGESLRQRLDREGPLPVAEVVRLLREVADALGFAHRHGIIHRDLKPANILLSEGHALVADFGIAKALGAATAVGEVTQASTLTATGLVLGTPAYMAPEQATSDVSTDQRADLYALGCLGYELLTGRPPFQASSVRAMLTAQLIEPPTLVTVHRPDVPPALATLIMQLLAKDPGLRPQSAEQVLQGLATADQPVHPTQVASTGRLRGGVRRVRGVAIGLSLTAVLLAAAGAAVLLRERTATRARGSGEGGAVSVSPASAGRLVVLPFDNLGDSADAYFADGVTDAIRGKLAAVPGLAVIARASSVQYKGAAQDLRQIGRELNVQYLLTGTVRWDKRHGASRVLVNPELVQAATSTTKWQAPFDAPLTDVFQVQADIAGEVAQALNVALGDSAKQELTARPTQSLPAYEAFLRGEAASQGMSVFDTPSLRQAIAAYEQAVALDSTFVRAWAQLARAQAWLYLSAIPTPAIAEAARRAAQQALALAPTRPEGHQALGQYYFVAKDCGRAFTEDSTALVLAPGNPELLGDVAASEACLGRWDAARGHLEQAARLDPRSSLTFKTLGYVLLETRDYPEAERTLDHAIKLAPANLILRHYRVMVALAQGDLPGAQAVLRAAPKEVDPTALVSFMAIYGDLMWVLDDAQQRLLLRLTPSAFDDDRSGWAATLAMTYALRGNAGKARAYADSSRLDLERRLRTAPQDASLHSFLGLMLAHLGQKAAAIREGRRGVELLPTSRDALNGPYLQHYLARIYLLVGEPGKALDQLEPLLKIPYYLSRGWLKIDPNFAPLRGNPRFERLVEDL